MNHPIDDRNASARPQSIDMLDLATQMNVIAGTPLMRVPSDHIRCNQKKVQ